MLASCSGPQTAWTTLDPPEIPDGAEAFVVVGDHALHVTNAAEDRGLLYGHIVRAWRLPPVGAVGIAADSRTSSPEEIARRAGWQSVRVANPQLAVPIATIRSARATVEVESDEDVPASSEGVHRAVLGVFGAGAAIIDVATCPCPCYWRR